MYKSCYIESINGRWYIMWPDCTKAWDQGYKTRSWAVRMLNYLDVKDSDDGNKKERHPHICAAVVGSSERLEESILERRAQGRQKRN